MAPRTRPVGYTRWATDGGADVVEPNEGRKDTGFEDGDEASEAEHNWLKLNGYNWERALDGSTPGVEFTGVRTWVSSSLRYAVGASLTQALTPGTAWIDGIRVQFDAELLAAIGETTHTFDASSTSTVSVNPDARLLDVRVGGGAPAGYTDVLSVVTDGSGVTECTATVESPGAPGGILEGLRVSQHPLELRKEDANTLAQNWVSDDVVRWRWNFLGNEDLRIERFSSAGADLGVVFGLNAANGGVVLNGRASEIPNAPASASDAVVGQLGVDSGITVMGSSVARVAFCNTATQADALIEGNNAGRLSLLSQGTTGLEIDASDQFVRPTADNTVDLGQAARRFSEAHVVTANATRLRGVGSQTLNLGASDTTGDLIVQGDGSTPSAAPFIRIQNHLGQAGGAFDANSAKVGFRVGDTNTNGTEDIILIGSSDVLPSRAYMIEAKILGVENGDATDGYGRRMLRIYQNTDSTAIAFAATIEDTGAAGGYGGWPGTASAALSIDGSNNIVLRVTATDTVTRNWSVLLTMHDIDHDD